VVLYEMLTGQAPFTGDSPVAVAYKHVQEPPTAPSEIRPGIPPDLEAVVLKAMAKNPANRYATAAEMREDLERVLHGQPVIATPLMPPEQATQVLTRPRRDTAVLPVPAMDERRGRRRRLLAGILIGLLVLGALVAGLIILATSLIGSTPTVKVPRVVGQPVENAKIILQQNRLKFSITEKSSARPEGEVIDQTPDPGTEVKENTTVQLTVSAGRKQVVVPDLTGMTLLEATTALQAVHLQLGQRLSSEPSDTIKRGRIIRTEPPVGTQVAAGTAINYVVSSGAATAVVPDVICKSVDDATAELEDAGFQVASGGQADESNPGCPELDRVATTDPPPGTEVQAGSTVTIFTSFPPPSPTGPTGPTAPTGPTGPTGTPTGPT